MSRAKRKAVYAGSFASAANGRIYMIRDGASRDRVRSRFSP